MPLRRLSHRSSVAVHRPQCRVFFKGCTAVCDAAPHSCRSVYDNVFRWRTLEQTCSRGDPGSAICVQRLDDSLNSAIHTRYRSLLRSSSMHEPRDPPSEVVKFSNRHIAPKRHKVLKMITQKTKDERHTLRPGGRCNGDPHRFKCSIQFNAGSTPPRSPIFSCQCTVFHRCRVQATTARIR